jgi:hypothetical protein
MNKKFKFPPQSKKLLTDPNFIAQRLSKLVGQPFFLTGKTRTDGSNVRKLVAATLEKYPLPELAEIGQFEIVPPKGKGIPKIALEFVDTYIVSSGISYNLQVWNRIPSAETLLIRYDNGENLKCTDVRFVFVKINIEELKIASVVILTPGYIVKNFGVFGQPTIKHQLLISKKVRQEIYGSFDKILVFPDSKRMTYYIQHEYRPPNMNMTEEPNIKNLYSIELLRIRVAEKLIGFKLGAASTKNRGQALEKKTLELLGYTVKDEDLLYGAYPDIRNQLLEVKVQDSPTVDLGKFSPNKEEVVAQEFNLTTFDVRYLIVLTNPQTEIIEGVILCPGEKLGEIFSYVSTESYKCQRAIPMKFFEKYDGRSVFNPK